MSPKIWEAEWDVSEDLAQRLIGRQFPQLAARPVRRLGYGWDNTVYRVGDEYVFRFPRRDIAVELLQREGMLLPKLADRLPIPFPKPMFYGEADDEYPCPFLGYTYVSGTFPIGLSDEQRTASAPVLAQFLKSLHSTPVSIAKEARAPLDHRNLRDVAARKERMQQFLADLSALTQEEEIRTVAGYLERLEIGPLTQSDVLLHGDLHFKNMLVDEAGRVSGIIDWGDIGIGHPGCDLNIVYSFLPAEARSRFFEEYGEVDEATKGLARMMAVYIPMLIWMQALDAKEEAVAAEARAVIRRALED